MDKRHYLDEDDVDDRPVEHKRGSGDFIDLDKLFTIAIRRVWMVAACVVVAIVIGIVYLVVAPQAFSAQTSILLDNNLAKYASAQPSPAPQQAETDTEVSSEIEILKSQQLALSVVDKLALDKNEEFMNPPVSPVEWLKGSMKSILAALSPHDVGKSSRPNEGDDPARLQAAALLQQSLDVARSARSLVLNVTYTANDPDLAAQIARTYASEYLSDQLNANFDATQRATIWLQQRLGDLKESARKASMAAERYKAENGLTLASGQLVSEQQLSDINTQLIKAQADLATASARYNQYKSIVDAGPQDAVTNATVSSSSGDITTDNSVLTKLKAQYLNVANRADAVEARFGKEHPQVVSLRKQQQELAGQIYQELKQLTTSYRNDYEVAKSRVDSLRQNIAKLTGKTSDANKSLVHLKELQQRADALNQLYQDYLSRYEEASQQRTFPIAKARVISEAGVPTGPSSPSKKIVLGLSMVLGLMFGGGFAAVAEFRERSFRTEEDVRSALDVKFLGYLPELPESVLNAPAPSGDAAPLMNASLRVGVDRPGSSYAETLRSVKLAADIVLAGRQCRVIGLLSALPHEGKTTVAANFAGLLAASGAKTLLIDADLRNPGLSRQLLPPPSTGLVDAVTGRKSWAKCVRVDPRSRLAVLPSSVSQRHLQHSSELLACEGMVDLMQSARKMFDYVVVDLPPSKAVVDAQAIEPMIDAFVAVARWGETPRAVLRSVLEGDRRLATKLLGLVLNRTDMQLLPRYVPFGGAERYISRYADYYQDES